MAQAKNTLLASLLEAMQDMHDIGLVDDKEMQDFVDSCLRRRRSGMEEKELHERLAGQGIRIFTLKIGSLNMTYIHSRKTTDEWRADVREYIDEINKRDYLEGCSDDAIYNELLRKMADAGYMEVADVASDVYEGRVVVQSARIEDSPIHSDQLDGFGHHGWESKTCRGGRDEEI